MCSDFNNTWVKNSPQDSLQHGFHRISIKVEGSLYNYLYINTCLTCCCMYCLTFTNSTFIAIAKIRF